MKIAISTESAADMSAELIEKFGVHVVPFTVTLGEKETAADGVITPRQIFNFVKSTGILPKTSAINEVKFKEHFSKLLKNYDAVVHISLSQKFSATFDNAARVSSNMNNVYVIDSKSLSTGIALLVIYAAELAQSGKTAEDIFELVQQRTSNVQASFVLERLDYLHKGGRCSSVARFAATLLRIKPQIYLKDGKLNVGKKYFGRIESAVHKYCADTLTVYNKPCLDYGFITYSSATPEMLEAARTAMKNAGFKTIYETSAGATITSHCGENTLGILYFNSAD